MGMEYQFVRHEPCADRVLFVLTLDRQKMKERIIAGESQQIHFRLKGSTDAKVLCDVTRPLGTFLIGFENDPDNNWNLHGLMPLYNALHTNRWKQTDLEKSAGGFLQEKYQSLDPVRQYAAFRIWNGYLITRQYRDRAAASDQFLSRMDSLTAAFRGESPLSFDKETRKPKRYDISSRIFGHIPAEDTRLDLWYPDNRSLTAECVAAYASFYPLLIYYTTRLADWGLHFCKCKVCGKIFLASSLRYELCSEKCRKAQALQNKRDFDTRARENNFDLLYKNECQNWRNKINRAKRTANFPADRLEKVQAAFSAFKEEALQRKKQIKEQKTSPQEFTDWLYQQSGIIINLLGGS